MSRWQALQKVLTFPLSYRCLNMLQISLPYPLAASRGPWSSGAEISLHWVAAEFPAIPPVGESPREQTGAHCS